MSCKIIKSHPIAVGILGGVAFFCVKLFSCLKTVHNCRFSPSAPNPRRQHKNLQKYSKLKSISHIELCIHIGIYNIVLLVYLNYKMGDFWWYVYVKNIYNSIKLCAKNGTTPFNANLCNPNLHANLHTNINVCTAVIIEY